MLPLTKRDRIETQVSDIATSNEMEQGGSTMETVVNDTTYEMEDGIISKFQHSLMEKSL